MAGWVWNEGVELCQSNQHLCCLPKEMRLFETACWFGMLPGGHNPEFKASVDFLGAEFFLWLSTGRMSWRNTRRQHLGRLAIQLRLRWQTFFSVSELAECVPSANKLLRDFQQLANNGWMKVAYPPLEGYPCAVSLFWCFFPEKSSEKQRHSRAEGAIFFDPVVYASSQPFQTLLVSEAVVSRGWWVKSGSRRECFEFSSVWKQDLKNPGVVVTAAIRKGTVYHHCLQTGHYVTVKSGSKQPIWWWHGFQRSDDLQMGWSREMADDVLKRFKQCSVVRSVWRRFDTSTLLSWCEDVMD